jgi:hypothetical protein
MATERAQHDTDFNGKRAFNPATPTVGLDVLRLQDVAVGTGLLKAVGVNVVPLQIAQANVDYMAALNLTAGSVLFSGGGAVISQDNANFYYDNANDRLILRGGAYTPASGAPLTISGATSGGTAILLNLGGGLDQGIERIGGSLTFNVEAGNYYRFRTAGNERITIDPVGNISFQNGAQSGNPGPMFAFIPASHTSLNAGTEQSVSKYFSSTYTWNTGSLSTQRFHLFFAPTIAFSGPSTVQDAATVAISGAPTAGTNATISNNFALWVQAGGIRAGGTIRFESLAGASSALVEATTTGTLQRSAITPLTGGPFTAGSVIFATGASTLGQDNGNFFYDIANSRLLLGTNTTAAATLVIASSVSNVAILLNQAATQNVDKSGGTLQVGTTDANILTLRTNDVIRMLVGTTGAILFQQTAHTAGAGASFSGYNFGAQTLTRPSGGITTDRWFLVAAPTYAFSGSTTITNAATLAIAAAPTPGSNATITNNFALWVQAGGIRAAGEIRLETLAGSGTALVEATATGALQRSSGAALTGGPFTAGSVIFATGGSALGEDNANFYFDNANNRLVLVNGSSFTPAAGSPLTVMGSAVIGGGRNTADNSSALHVSRTNTTIGTLPLIVESSSTSGGVSGMFVRVNGLDVARFQGDFNNNLVFGAMHVGSITFVVNDAQKMIVTSGGAFGLGASVTPSGSTGFRWKHDPTVASATGATLDTFLSDACTTTITGTNTIDASSQAAGFANTRFAIPVFNMTNGAVNHPATVQIDGAPVLGTGSAVVQFANALWVRSGATRTMQMGVGTNPDFFNGSSRTMFGVTPINGSRDMIELITGGGPTLGAAASISFYNSINNVTDVAANATLGIIYANNFNSLFLNSLASGAVNSSAFDSSGHGATVKISGPQLLGHWTTGSGARLMALYVPTGTARFSDTLLVHKLGTTVPTMQVGAGSGGGTDGYWGLWGGFVIGQPTLTGAGFSSLPVIVQNLITLLAQTNYGFFVNGTTA